MNYALKKLFCELRSKKINEPGGKNAKNLLIFSEQIYIIYTDKRNARKGEITVPNFSYNIEKHIGVISEGSGGWQKELNLISWNGKDAKYDIRDWSPDHENMSKGITLSAKDVKALKELLDEIEFSD